MGVTRVGRTISAIGRKANAVVDKSRNQYATAHDLRRSFGTRWSKKVAPAVLKNLMRHRSIETTMAFYVSLDSDDMAADLWQAHAADQTGEVRTFVRTGQNDDSEAVSEST